MVSSLKKVQQSSSPPADSITILNITQILWNSTRNDSTTRTKILAIPTSICLSELDPDIALVRASFPSLKSYPIHSSLLIFFWSALLQAKDSQFSWSKQLSWQYLKDSPYQCCRKTISNLFSCLINWPPRWRKPSCNWYRGEILRNLRKWRFIDSITYKFNFQK